MYIKSEKQTQFQSISAQSYAYQVRKEDSITKASQLNNMYIRLEKKDSITKASQLNNKYIRLEKQTQLQSITAQ